MYKNFQPFIRQKKTLKVTKATKAPKEAEEAQIIETNLQRQFSQCFNRHQCCESWANFGECRRNVNYMQQYCQAACKVCNATFDSTNGSAN